MSGALPRRPERAYRALLTALLLGATLPCAAHDALQAIDRCLGKLDPSLDVGYVRIAERCPELSAALSGSIAAWLPADWRQPDNQLSASGLAELRQLLLREATRQPARPVIPSTRALGPVLAAMTQEPQTDSWWSRFKQWLRRVMFAQRQPDRGWLQGWLQGLQLPERWTQFMTWGALAVVVMLALAMVLYELRAAGVLAARAARSSAPGAQRRGAAGATLDDIAGVAGREQPALLLQLIASVLTARALLPPERALTARELLRRAQLADSIARAQLQRLVEVCERIRFAAQEVGESERVRALEDGRALLASVGAAAAVVPG